MSWLVAPTGEIPLPVPTALSRPFWEACGRGELWHQRCGACGRTAFPPAHVCRNCRAAELVWEQGRGEGQLYSWSIVWRPQTPAFPTPYAPALVELDEGHVMLSCLVGCDAADVRAGMRLRVVFEQVQGAWLPYFTPSTVTPSTVTPSTFTPSTLHPLDPRRTDMSVSTRDVSFEASPEQLLPDLDDRARLVLLARTLWSAGHNDGLAGHITIRQPDGTFLCNPWLLLWSELRPADVLRIDADGNRLEGRWPVPPGIPLHLELHRRRHDVHVAMHNHPMYGTIWSDLREVPPPMDQSSATGGGVVVIVNEYDGAVDDAATAGAVIDVMGDADIALLAGHGVFVLGDTVPELFHRAVSLEWRCRQAWHIRAAGGSLTTPLSDAAIDRWQRRRGGLHGYWEAMARAELRADPQLLNDLGGASS